MTGEMGGHDLRPGPGLSSFLDQVGQRLIHESLKLTALLHSDRADGGEYESISVSTLVANFSRVLDMAPVLPGWIKCLSLTRDEAG